MELNDGVYQIDGLNITELCQKYDTPLYVYNANKMAEQFNKMKTAFSVKDLKINYACKALTNINVLKYFKNLGAGLDTLSIQELWLGLKAGFKPEDIIYTPNCVSFEEIKLAVK